MEPTEHDRALEAQEAPEAHAAPEAAHAALRRNRNGKHPRLVAFIPVHLRLWSAGHKRTASPACAGRAAALL